MNVLDEHVGNSKHCTVDPSKLCKVTVNFKDGCCEFGLFCRIRIRGKETPVRLSLHTALNESSVADPGSGSFLTPGSRIRDEFFFSGSRIPAFLNIGGADPSFI
jgi:hypothetical protein